MTPEDVQERMDIIKRLMGKKLSDKLKNIKQAAIESK